MPLHQVRKQFSYGGNSITSGAITRTAVTEANIDKSIPDGTYREPFNRTPVVANIQDFSVWCDKNVTIYINGIDDQQTYTHPGSGTPTLTFAAVASAGIASTSTAAQVQTILEAVSTIGVGNVVVTGGTGGPYLITFRGTLGLAPQSLMTASAGGPLVHTTTGVVPSQTFAYIAAEPFDWQTNNGFVPTFPITGTPIKMSVTNLSGGNAAFKVYCGLNG